MKYVIFSCLFLLAISATSCSGNTSTRLTSAGSESKLANSLPKPEDIFTIAINPIPSLLVKLPFTTESLREALPNFRPGEPEIKNGAKRIWESGVIVLNDKEVLFWTTCRKNFIYVQTPPGHVSFIVGNGKDDL